MPARYAIHKLIEAMIANRQQADLASAFMEAWDRGDHWKAAIRTSLATYGEDFRASFSAELANAVTELGSVTADYDLGGKPKA